MGNLVPKMNLGGTSGTAGEIDFNGITTGTSNTLHYATYTGTHVTMSDLDGRLKRIEKMLEILLKEKTILDNLRK